MRYGMKTRMLLRLAVCLGLCGLAWTARAAEKEPAPAKLAAPASDKQLDAAMSALRDRVRQTLARYIQQPINTSENTAGEVLDYCLAFDVDAEVRYGNNAGNPINAIGCLCFNYPCGGYEILAQGEKGKPVARTGYGLQRHPGQLLAVLAQSAVPLTYEIRIGDFKGTIADLVESEKLACRSGGNLAHRLIAMSFYIRNGETWTSASGEEWSVERLLKEELARKPASDRSDIADHLTGLSFALQRRTRQDKPIDGQWKRAEKYVADFQQYAMELQNGDGSWHPNFFAARGAARDPSGTLRSTGHILEWLVFSLPAERLNDPRVVRSVSYLTGSLSESYGRWNVTATSPNEVDSVAHALHALRLYDKRYFKQFEPEATDDAPAAKAARRASSATRAQ